MFVLADSSALVLSLADRSIYTAPSALRFLDNLKLDAGRELFEKIAKSESSNPVFPATINNRKFAVKKACSDFLDASPNAQVVFLGAGLDPKSLDIAELYPQCTVFDIDRENLDLKQEILKEVDGPNNIRFCHADLANLEEFKVALSGSGWNRESPTMIVAEGISYYIERAAFKKVLLHLKSPGGKLLFEHFVSDDEVKEMARAKVYTTFCKDLLSELNLSFDLQPYSIEQIHDLALTLGGQVSIVFKHQDLELERTGSSKNFLQDDGYARIALISF